tara:strand:- start:12 stop:191 length:180 start_codon:yes stop_codon:yes gene_type:complete
MSAGAGSEALESKRRWTSAGSSALGDHDTLSEIDVTSLHTNALRVSGSSDKRQLSILKI